MAVTVRKICGSFGNALVNCSFLVPKQTSKPQVAGLITKAMRDKDPNYKKPVPFPYKERKYRTIDSFFDTTTWRFDENSKVVVVDGPITSRKEEVAKSIAEIFDLHYVPHANLDTFFINQYGTSITPYNHLLPFKLRSFYPHQFVANPYDKRNVMMQMNYARIRLAQYIDALSHVLNTGQGVVMNRCIYTDLVFLEAYVKCGFYPKRFREMYQKNWNAVAFELMRPHLIIYLDTPVDMIRENLKKRNNPVELNSPVYQPAALREFENVYKNMYLKEYGKHAEVLAYNMDDFDLEVMVEDMEEVNLQDYKKHDPKMEDWRLPCEATWNLRRIRYQVHRNEIEAWLFNIEDYDLPESVITGEELQRFSEIYNQLPGNEYAPGYNEKMGDYVMFKNIFKS